MTPDEIERVLGEGRMRRDLDGRLATVAEARGHFETLVRLAEIEEQHRSLTPAQTDDRDIARGEYNRAARSLGLPEIRAGENWSEGDWQKTKDMLYGVEAATQRVLADQERRAEFVRNRPAWLDPAVLYDRDSGLAPGSRSRDPIRDMLTAGERQHDFPFLETAAIRALPELDDESRAISDFANGASLYMNDFAGRVAMYARTISPWLGLATVVTSDNGRPLLVPTLTGDVTVYSPGEGTAITASDPTLGTVSVTPSGFKALSYISREAFDDESVNLTDVLAASHARAIGLAFGSTATTAVLSGINNGGTATGAGGNGTATSTFVGYEDLIDLQLGRAAPYRQAGSWVMANGMIKKVKKYRDQNGQYLWPAGDLPLGGRVYEDPYLAAPASATKSVVYGDLGAALIIKATPIRVELSKDFLFDKDQIAIRSVQRIALAVQDPAAAAYLVSANT